MKTSVVSSETSTTDDGLLDLPAPPSRIRVRTPPTGQFEPGPRVADNPLISSSAKSAIGNSYCSHSSSPLEPLLVCPGSGSSSGRSESSTDCWVSAVIPRLDDCGGPAGSSSSSSSSWAACQQADPVSRQATCPEASNSTTEAAAAQTPGLAGLQQAVSPQAIVQLVATPMQDLATLLSGCPPQLHIAFMKTAAALAEQQQQQQQQQKQDAPQAMLLAEQGYEQLDKAQADLLLQQQQAQRYSCVPIAALPSLLAAAVPHWPGADVGYAALQIRCHLNVIANFSVDTPIAAAHPRSPAAAASQQSDKPEQQSDRPQQQQQQLAGGCSVAVDPPCDLMYSELASTILAAAATEAAVTGQQVPAAAQSLLVDLTAELSSRPELQDRLQQAFTEAAAAAAAAVVTASWDSSSARSSCVAQSQSFQGAGAGEQAAAVLPVVKAVKLLCRLLVGPTGLSDIRLLAWLTALVRQQHLANQHADSSTLAAAAAATASAQPAQATAAAAAAASVQAAAAVISCAQLLAVLGQLLENLTGQQGTPAAAAAAAAAAGCQAVYGFAELSCGFPCDWHQSHDSSEEGVDAASTGGSFSVWAVGSAGVGGSYDHQPQHSRSSAAGSGSLHQGSSRGNSSSQSGSGSPRKAADELVVDSGAEVQWAGGGAGHRRRARQHYRSSSGGSSAGGGLRPSSSTWEHMRSGLDIPRSHTGSSTHGSSAAAAAGMAAVYAAFGLGAPCASGSSNSSSSIGRAAHRPLSSHSSFGEDVWSIVAAATAAAPEAGAAHILLHEHLAEQLSSGQHRPLLHQSTWPDRATSRSSGSNQSSSSSSSSSSTDGGSRPVLKPSRSRLSRLSMKGASVEEGADSTTTPAAAGSTSKRPSSDTDAVSHNGSPVLHHSTVLQCGPAVVGSGRARTAGRTMLTGQHPTQVVCLEQRQAWQAEMLLEQQPWEGAISPVALCANLVFGWGQGCASGLVEQSTGPGSRDGQSQRVVNILRISTCSSCSSFGCIEAGGESGHICAGATGCA